MKNHSLAKIELMLPGIVQNIDEILNCLTENHLLKSEIHFCYKRSARVSL